MNIRQQIPWVVRKPNRAEPLAVIPRRKHQPDVYVHEDGTVSLAYLTRAEAQRIYDLAQTDIHLFPLCYALAQMLGIDEEAA